ncbi:MAG: hypothetical protein R6U22_11905 [Desulfohalobiaceae bacterium]
MQRFLRFRGNECQMAGLNMIFGPQATVDSVGVYTFETQTGAADCTRELGARMRDTLASA